MIYFQTTCILRSIQNRIDKSDRKKLSSPDVYNCVIYLKLPVLFYLCANAGRAQKGTKGLVFEAIEALDYFQLKTLTTPVSTVITEVRSNRNNTVLLELNFRQQVSLQFSARFIQLDTLDIQCLSKENKDITTRMIYFSWRRVDILFFEIMKCF